MNKFLLAALFSFILFASTAMACEFCYVKNITCPTNVAPGENFAISFQFSGTGPDYPFQYASLVRDDNTIVCRQLNKGACIWNSYSFTTTAPDTAGTYTYGVKCYAADSIDSGYCGMEDDSTSCTVNVGSTSSGYTATASVCTKDTDCLIGKCCSDGVCRYPDCTVQCQSNSDCYGKCQPCAGGRGIISCSCSGGKCYPTCCSSLTVGQSCSYSGGICCANGQCQSSCPKTCTNQCTYGTSRCTPSPDTGIDQCFLQSDGCYYWKTIIPQCQYGCLNGACKSQTCTHDCSGGYKCESNKLFDCGECDTDNCWDWCLKQTCPSGTTCDANKGECISKTCTGSISLTLSPTKTSPNTMVTASLSGVSGCNRDIYVRQGSCDGGTACTCSISTSSNTCTCSFYAPSPSTASSYTYFACVDKDNDGKFGVGESSPATLTVDPGLKTCKDYGLCTTCLGTVNNLGCKWCDQGCMDNSATSTCTNTITNASKCASAPQKCEDLKTCQNCLSNIGITCKWCGDKCVLSSDSCSGVTDASKCVCNVNLDVSLSGTSEPYTLTATISAGGCEGKSWQLYHSVLKSSGTISGNAYTKTVTWNHYCYNDLFLVKLTVFDSPNNIEKTAGVSCGSAKTIDCDSNCGDNTDKGKTCMCAGNEITADQFCCGASGKNYTYKGSCTVDPKCGGCDSTECAKKGEGYECNNNGVCEFRKCTTSDCSGKVTNKPCMCGSTEIKSTYTGDYYCCAAKSSIGSSQASCRLSCGQTPGQCSSDYTSCQNPVPNSELPCLCGNQKITGASQYCCAAANYPSSNQQDCLANCQGNVCYGSLVNVKGQCTETQYCEQGYYNIPRCKDCPTGYKNCDFKGDCECPPSQTCVNGECGNPPNCQQYATSTCDSCINQRNWNNDQQCGWCYSDSTGSGSCMKGNMAAADNWACLGTNRMVWAWYKNLCPMKYETQTSFTDVNKGEEVAWNVGEDATTNTGVTQIAYTPTQDVNNLAMSIKTTSIQQTTETGKIYSSFEFGTNAPGVGDMGTIKFKIPRSEVGDPSKIFIGMYS